MADDVNPMDLLKRVKLLSEREFAGLFAAAVCKDDGETHENLEKIIADFEMIKTGAWLLAMMQAGEFSVGWDAEKGEVIHTKTTPEQKARILAAIEDFDKLFSQDQSNEG